MQTSAPSMRDLFEDESTSSSEGRPANPTAPRARGSAPKTLGTFGPSTHESSRRHSPVGSLLRMSLASALQRLTRSSATWSRSTTPCGRSWWVLGTPERRTDATGSGLLPTPTAQHYGTRNNGCPGDGREQYATRGAPSLETMARQGLLPTPTWQDGKSSGSRNKEGSKAKPGVSLTDWAMGDRGLGRSSAGAATSSLPPWAATDAPTAAAIVGTLLPTPDANSWKQGERGTGTGGGQQLNTGWFTARTGEDGPTRLDPRFVQWLMGYPPGWLGDE
jgi:hypothetical protein